MKRPAFQFYPADWRNNAKLRRCSWEARGAWLEIMCLFHDNEDEYGLLRWPLKEIAQAIGAPLKLIKELADKGVIKGSDKAHEALIYTPRSGRKDGDPVTLVQPGDGPMWMSSRMVIDEHVRKSRGNYDLHNDSPNKSPKPPPKAAPKPPLGDLKSDLPSSSSSSTTSLNTKNTSAVGTLPPEPRPIENQNPEPQTPAGQVCLALKRTGMANVNPQHPKLLALIDRGATVEQFTATAIKAIGKGDPFAYLLGAIEGQIRDAATVADGPSMPTAAWNATRSGVEAMGVRLGVGEWDEYASQRGTGESFGAYERRVTKAFQESHRQAA